MRIRKFATAVVRFITAAILRVCDGVAAIREAVQRWLWR